MKRSTAKERLVAILTSYRNISEANDGVCYAFAEDILTLLESVAGEITWDEDDIYAYARGLATASVCVPEIWTREEVEAAMNRAYPTGIDGKWHISSDPYFADGEDYPNPCKCSTAGRLHYLMEC